MATYSEETVIFADNQQTQPCEEPELEQLFLREQSCCNQRLASRNSQDSQSASRLSLLIYKPIKLLMLTLIKAYQLFISPLLGNRCRFYPSCSNYAQQALNQQGVLRGSWLILKRLCRCHPFHPGGVDMVPNKEYKPLTNRVE